MGDCNPKIIAFHSIEFSPFFFPWRVLDVIRPYILDCKLYGLFPFWNPINGDVYCYTPWTGQYNVVVEGCSRKFSSSLFQGSHGIHDWLTFIKKMRDWHTLLHKDSSTANWLKFFLCAFWIKGFVLINTLDLLSMDFQLLFRAQIRDRRPISDPSVAARPKTGHGRGDHLLHRLGV